MTDFAQTQRNRVKRLPDRGKYDKATIYPIIDEAIICHVGFTMAEQPFMIPTLHVRQGDDLLLHGATTSRMLKHIQEGNSVCVTVTLIDGLVMARSVFHHSVNYRSAILFGTGEVITDPEEKMAAMRLFTDKIMPGRWDDARQPYAKEIKATSMVRLAIESASAKVRNGPPGDDDEDYALPVWAGIIPFTQQIGSPINDPLLNEGIAVPDYVNQFIQAKAVK
jgi:nitroimidazol reductase NimA-like FMN-containing flavoprotein (pyridoxamine 5'-phosphate oxidase superfamily)